MRELLQAIHDQSIFDAKKHKYEVKTLGGEVAGTQLVSVTTVIKETLAKGEGFLQWIANETYTSGSKYAWKSKKDRDVGIHVHGVAENWSRRKCGLPEVVLETPSAEAQYLASGLPGWLDASGLKPILPEVRLFDLDWGVAGTADLFAEWNGALVCVDYKTCSKADTSYLDWTIQISAYVRMVRKLTGKEFQGLVCRIPKSGDEPSFLPLGIDDRAVEAFECLLKLYRWMHRNDVPKTRKSNVVQATEKFLQKEGA